MEREGASWLSLTDADARLMKGESGFQVACNPQAAADSETHLIRDFEMTNAPTDHGQLLPTMSRVAEATDGVVEVTADRQGLPERRRHGRVPSGRRPAARDRRRRGRCLRGGAPARAG